MTTTIVMSDAGAGEGFVHYAAGAMNNSQTLSAGNLEAPAAEATSISESSLVLKHKLQELESKLKDKFAQEMQELRDDLHDLQSRCTVLAVNEFNKNTELQELRKELIKVRNHPCAAIDCEYTFSTFQLLVI